jgi:F-type H+-transporting ATPase subunit b
MPQLDFSTFAPQIFWLALTFVVLYFILARRVLPRIGEVIEARAKRISDDLEQAEKLKREAEETIRSYEAALAQARGKAQAVLSDAKTAAVADTAKRQAELDARIERDGAAAESAIAAARERATAEIRIVAQGAAADIANRVAGLTLSGDAVARAVAAEIEKR